MFLRITPTALEEYSPVLSDFFFLFLKKEKHREEILTVEVICVASWGERFSPISTSFPLVSSRALRDAPHSRFRCRDPNQCLPNFLKMLLLALSQIYTRVFHLWRYIDLDNAQNRRDRATRSVILTNFGSISWNLGDISESQGL